MRCRLRECEMKGALLDCWAFVFPGKFLRLEWIRGGRHCSPNFNLGKNLNTTNSKSRIILIGLLVVLLAAMGCGAATKGQVRYRAGLAALEAGDYVGAIKLFNESLEAVPDQPGPLILRAHCFELLDRDNEAFADYSAALAQVGKSPIDEDGTIAGAIYHNRGMLYMRRGEYSKALEDFEQYLRIGPPGPYARNSIAWLLATCPDKSLHNPTRAVRLATEAAEMDDFKNAAVVDTLAAAYAVNGEFDKAVMQQTKVLELLGDGADEGMRNRLELYKAKQPYIDVMAENVAQ